MMATATGLQRSVSAATPPSPGRLPNLPVIEHPMSRLGDRADLAVRGSSTLGRHAAGSLTRSQTDVGFKQSRPDVNDVRKSTPERILNWPPGLLRDVTFLWLHGHKTLGTGREPVTRRFNEHVNFSCRDKESYRTNSHIAVDITPPYHYKEEPYKGLLPDIPDTPRDYNYRHVPGKVDKYPKIGQVPKLPPLPSIDEQEEHLKGPGKPHVKSKEYNYQPRNTQELIEVIREKFGTGYYGIRHLFRSNDPTGKGAVSREALQKILYTLCGYITPDQYTKLLRAMHLEGKTPIHFDTFVQFFKETEDKKNWVSALQTAPLHQVDPSYPEVYLRRTDMRVHDPYTSMPFSDAIFKEKCKSKNFDARRVFPAAVFEAGGLILPPQLREAHATLGIYMTDEDFSKLWQRYDKEGTGALHRDDFFRACGLNAQGRPRQAPPYTPRGAAYPRPRPHSEIGNTACSSGNSAIGLRKNVKTDGDLTDRTAVNLADTTGSRENRQHIDIPTGAQEAVAPAGRDLTEKDKGVGKPDAVANTEKKIDIKKLPKQIPKLENIIDCLHYKFEEGYQSLLTAFQLFDFLNDGWVSRIDFRRVLAEFALPISPTELDHFLKRSGLRPVKGQVNYREFLGRYQAKSMQALTARAATDSQTVHADGGSGADGMSAELLEARLVDFLHGDLIKLIAHFRRCDRYNLHVVTAHEFRAAIEARLGYAMTEQQWETIRQEAGTDRDGLLQYTKFIELFDVTPGSWNLRAEGGIQVAQVPAADLPVPPQVDRLRERAKTEMVPPPQPPPADNKDSVRSLDEYVRKREKMLTARLDELFKNRFHTFDKHFKAMDRRMTGRMSKWQFGALLKMCGLSLLPAELDRAWATLNISTDGMYSYSTLIQHFVNYKIPHEQKENVIYDDTKELVEVARRIQRERREEQMKRDHLARTQARSKNEDWVPEVTTFDERTPRAVTASTSVSSVPTVPASRASFASVQSVRTKSLLVKIRTDVINNWEGLKSVFKYIDRNGTCYIPSAEMKEIMTSLQFSMDEEEKAELCRRFDTDRNGRFNYMRFMKCYAQRTASKGNQGPAYSKFTHQLQTQLDVRGRVKNPTVHEVIQVFRDKLCAAEGSVRRAFRRLDRGRKGHLTVNDFRRALSDTGITMGNEDFYHVLTEFDRNMDGKIAYDHFLDTLLAV
ncbi:EF-hand calcium-binding domain-containing protein 6-like isoform X5 [Mya arenaria]|uniref:EF-hand calcium-binding domain-containing protein 6-like isoform X5 n=1 Tax=Mya arenaria TaxID=6604 RepID=UPI0022E87C64|nr:EF-hand calcium-binding domain-containing protein 6-like isoform X5 [Mya arenaria]